MSKSVLPRFFSVFYTGTYLGKTIIQKDTCTQMFIAALFTIIRTWKQSKCPSTDVWIKKTYVYNGILLSHKKKWSCIICRDMDGAGEGHTERSRSEREKQMSYINTCICNLEKWYRGTYLRGKNRHRNGHVDVKGSGGMNWEIEIDICALPCVNRELVDTYSVAERAQLSAVWWPRWDRGRMGGGPTWRGDRYTHTHTHTQVIHFIL